MIDIGIDFPLTDIDSARELLEAIKEKRFTLKDVGVTSRVFNSWRTAGLIPDAGEFNKWARLDFRQYLWLKIIQDLRVFGVDHSTIQQLQSYLFTPTNVLDKLQDAKKEEFDLLNDRLAGVIRNLEKEDNLLEQVKNIDNEDFIRFASSVTLYDNLLFSQFIYRSNTYVIITLDKRFHYQSEFIQHLMPIPGGDVPHIRIPLSRYVFQFLSDETKAEFLPRLPIITEEEAEVLKAVRNGQLKEIKIKFWKDGKMTKMDIITTKDGELTEEESKTITEILGIRNYQTITLKKNNGSQLYFERDHRFKL